MSYTFLGTAAHPLNIAHSTQVSVLLLNKGTRWFEKNILPVPLRTALWLDYEPDWTKWARNLISLGQTFVSFLYLRDNKVYAEINC